MPTIIALKGRGGCGKSTTIRMIFDHLIANGYVLVSPIPVPPTGDFEAILQGPQKKVGIASAGDTDSLLKGYLDKFTSAGCDSIVCACRTKGATFYRVRSYPGYSWVYINKSDIGKGATAAQEQVANQADVSRIIPLI